MNLAKVWGWLWQAVLILVTFTLSVAIILLVTSETRLDIPDEAFKVGTPMLVLVLSYFINKVLLKNREETQKARDVMLEEIRKGLAEVLEVTKACLPRQKRELFREGPK